MTEFPSLDVMIDRLDLEPHPEGGYFRETWRSDLTLPADALSDDHDGPRSAGTSILYLLPDNEKSELHRVASDELWLFQYGDPLELSIQTAKSRPADTVTIGNQPGQDFQARVPANYWQSAQSLGGDAGFTLVACVVVPGFDFDDFEMG